MKERRKETVYFSGMGQDFLGKAKAFITQVKSNILSFILLQASFWKARKEHRSSLQERQSF